MNVIAHAAMVLWIPLTVVLVAVLRWPRGPIVALLAGALLLPMGVYILPGLPDYTKASATTLGAAIGALVARPNALFAIRPSWYDVPVIGVLVSPFVSSMINQFGPYEGLSGVLEAMLIWVLPYLIGRMCIRTGAQASDVLLCVVVATVVYLPLVLYELRMSPQLHRMIYGWFPHDFSQVKRGDSWRPQVFMQHGLALAAFMMSAALCAGSLAVLRIKPRLLSVSMWVIVAVLGLTSLMVRSTGAFALLIVGMASLATIRLTHRVWPIWCLAAVPPLYIAARVFLKWEPEAVVNAATALFGSERSGSLAIRLRSETLLLGEVRPSLWLGAGRFEWSGIRIDEERLIPDGLWMIVLGQRGLAGVVSTFGLLLVPVAAFLGRFRQIAGRDRTAVSAGLVLALLVSLHAVDSLLNAMLNPIFVAMAGGLVSLATASASRPNLGGRS